MSVSVNQTRQRLTDYINTTKRSQSAVAKELGISGAALSQFLNGSYIGSNEDIADKIEQFLDLDRKRKLCTPSPKFTTELNNTKLVYNALSYIQITSGIATIVGTAGSGKTTAMKHFADEHNGVIYVQADATKKSPRAALNLISKAMGVKPRGTASDILDNLVEELTGTGKVIIIDEAQHLTERSFDTLRAINDRACVGLVYAGTPDIIARMYGKHEAELDQVHSRIEYVCKLNNRYKLEDIEIVFADFKLNKTIIKQLYNVSSRKGGLRLAINLFKFANDLAVTAQEPLDIKHIEYAAKCIGSGGGII